MFLPGQMAEGSPQHHLLETPCTTTEAGASESGLARTTTRILSMAGTTWPDAGDATDADAITGKDWGPGVKAASE